MKKLIVFIAVFLLLAATANAKTVNLSWDPSPSTGVSAYRVYLSTDSGVLVEGQLIPEGLQPAQETDGATLSVTLENLDDSTGYYFSVTAGNGTDFSGQSNVVFSPPVFMPPTGLSGETIIQNISIPMN